MDRLDIFLQEVYKPDPTHKILAKTVYSDFMAWIVAKYCMAEWRHYEMHQVYHGFANCRYPYRRYSIGRCLKGLNYRDGEESDRLDRQASMPGSPALVRMRLRVISPIISDVSLTLPHPSDPNPTSTSTPSSTSTPTPTPTAEPSTVPAPAPPRPSSFIPRKTDRRHRPAPPKPKPNPGNVYVAGGSELPDLDQFCKPYLYNKDGTRKDPDEIAALTGSK